MADWSKYKIEKEVPVLPTSLKKGRFPFALMEVNDSILIELGDGVTAKLVNSAMNNYHKTNPNKKLTYRTIDESHVRVWRIK